MDAQQVQRIGIMGFDCIDREFQAVGYLLVGEFFAHLHQTDFPLLGYQLKDAAETKVPDIHGNNVFTVKAVKDGDTVKVSVEAAHTELKVEVFVGNEKKEAVLAADASEVVVA